jgi:hypothetical protein
MERELHSRRRKMFILSIIPLPLSGNTNDKNPTSRLAEIRGKIVVAEQRVRDLEALLTHLILNPTQDYDTDPGTPGIQPVSGVDNFDANSVRQGLYAARAYEGELRTAEQFWNEIVTANKQAEKDTHDLFKRA